jgi:glycine cleavage system H protein
MSGLSCLQTARLVHYLALTLSHAPLTQRAATLGISEYAANALGDVVYIELPQKDLEVSAGEAIGAVESVKSASDILTPISGKVVDVNETLESKPGNINKDPEGEAWIAKVEVEGEAEGKLMTKEEYTAFTEDA